MFVWCTYSSLSANWNFHYTDQKLSVIIINLALEFFNSHIWSSWWMQGFKEVLGVTICLFASYFQLCIIFALSGLSAWYLPCSSGHCHNLVLLLCILGTEDLLRMLEASISNVSSIWRIFVGSNLTNTLLFLVTAHSAS